MAHPDAPRPEPSRPTALLARLALGALNGALAVAERLCWPRAPRRARRVAVFRVGMIGDVLVALPAIAAVRRAHPEAELTVVSSPGPRGMPGARELLAGSPHVDRLLVYHADEVADARGRWRLLRRLRAERFDRVYVLPPELSPARTELRNLLFLRLAGVRWARGFAVHNARGLPAPLAAAHHATARFVPEWRRLCELLARRGGPAFDPADPPAPALPRPAATVARIDALAAELGLDRRPLLALAPGAKLAHKRWDPERFGHVARAWVEAGGVACVLGGPGDRELAAEVLAAAGPGTHDLCGRTDLLGSAELLRRARALVSNDTGTMHLGATVGTPLVALFSGSNRPVVWNPWPGGPQRILREPVGCSPCFAAPCPHDRACLRRIDVDRVLAALGELGSWPGADACTDPGNRAPALPTGPRRTQGLPTTGR